MTCAMAAQRISWHEIRTVRRRSSGTSIEVQKRDLGGRAEVALEILCTDALDVMNHNLETVSRLYWPARAGADYGHLLRLRQSFPRRLRDVPTKSGVEIPTVGQYLQPRPGNLPVRRYLPARSSYHGDRRALATSV